ncbi:MAG: 6-pyruvoyl trahydropterin synthase family protein [Candidatus Poseidoniales archaeon]|jgi:6-pyruvoyltetrahydropterin/6-carboxytetrahydropterin synthase|tara:strand:- start:16457 stop:16906 length:450 start_codon:yes stop_codon:yes gene_type:complete
MPTIIRRYVETDTGHRVPNHKSKCRHMHGHRYRFEAEIEGDLVTEPGVSDEGMLIDFSDVSNILNKYIHDVIDHSFIVYNRDDECIRALDLMGENHRTIKLDFIPTAENLAKWGFEQINPYIKSRYGNKLKLIAMHVRETPKSLAVYRI